jgi:hypothetical protein
VPVNDPELALTVPLKIPSFAVTVPFQLTSKLSPIFNGFCERLVTSSITDLVFPLLSAG